MKPILFDNEMVKAILDGRKTMTRRLAIVGGKMYPDKALKEYAELHFKYHKGDVLWVREAAYVFDWYTADDGKMYTKIVYEDGTPVVIPAPERIINKKWFVRKQGVPGGCFREAARIFLEVTDVRGERLQDTTEENAKAEGVQPLLDYEGYVKNGGPPIWNCKDSKYVVEGNLGGIAPVWSYRAAFFYLWDSLNAKRGYGLDANPWVYCISFKRISREEAER